MVHNKPIIDAHKVVTCHSMCLRQAVWAASGALRGHCADVYDICWSPDGQGLFSGGVDGSTIIWNVAKVLERHEPTSDCTWQFQRLLICPGVLPSLPHDVHESAHLLGRLMRISGGLHIVETTPAIP